MFHWSLLAADDHGAVGVMNDEVADAAHERTTKTVKTSSSDHNRCYPFVLSNTADHRTWLVTDLEPERPVYLKTVLHNS